MSPASDEVFVGLDLGTSGLKAVAVTVGGDILARSQASYPTSRPEPRAAEQAPADWLTALAEVVVALAAEAPAARWRCIGLAAMIPTLVTTDGEGVATGTAITWEDARAQQQADELLARTGDLYPHTGQRVDARYLLPMMLRLARDEPQRLARTTWMLAAKDYLFWWLTGLVTTDPSTATGYAGYRLEPPGWLDPVWQAADELAGRSLPRHPEVSPSLRTAGIRGELAQRLGLPPGLQVCLGVADSVAGAIGLGAGRAGDVAYIAGTSTVVLAGSDQPTLDPHRRYLVTPTAAPGSWGLEMDLLATGSATRWLARLVGADELELLQQARGRDRMAAPTFLPYLAPGEQGALWDPTLSGVMAGLELRHDAADLARGLLTGIALESRRCLGVLGEVTGGAGRVFLGGGGGAAGTDFGQELADATGWQVVPSQGTTDHSALGAARLAAHSCGADVASQDTGRTLTPTPAAAGSWAALAERHDRALRALGSSPQSVDTASPNFILSMQSVMGSTRAV